LLGADVGRNGDKPERSLGQEYAPEAGVGNGLSLLAALAYYEEAGVGGGAP